MLRTSFKTGIYQRFRLIKTGFLQLSSFFRYGLISLVMVMAGLSPISAQSAGKIAGSVIQTENGEPLPGANIIIVGTYLGAAADEDGAYYILNVPPGKYELQAIMVGFRTTKMVDVVVNSGKTTKVDFRLSSELIETEEVVVTAERPDVELDKTSTSAIVRFDEVEQLPGVRDIGDILSLTSDIIDGHFRGGREGEEYYILQGMGIVNPLDRSSAFMPIMSGIEEVEVITSGFSAEYGNAQSGVVNISMKEGDRGAWKTRLESNMRAPGRKHFGPSVFDPDANDYIRLLMDEEIWLSGDPNSDQAQPYYGAMLSGATGSFAGDTLVQLAIAQALWQQTKRDIGRVYGEEFDYSIEAATGGPINDKIRMFLALRTERESTVFPTEQPNAEYQVMGNVVTDLGKDMMLRLSGGYTQEFENVFPSRNSVSGYQGWLWDRITRLRDRKRVNAQLGVRLTKTITQSTFYEIKLNALFTDNNLGATPVPNLLPDSVTINWYTGTLGFPLNNSPDGLDYQAGYDDFTREKTRTLSFDGAFTSQITKNHLLNAGVQMNSYYIDVANFLSVRNNRYVENYNAHPFEAAIFAQDKMEFSGMIANVGLRFDLWYSGVNYYGDSFMPFSEPDSLGRLGEGEKPPVYMRLQPRLGFSFPISVNTTFHLNYGAFMQRPAFQYIVSRRTRQQYINPVIMGNPKLEPEQTNSYDIGVVHALGDGFTLDISGYYKDVKNLIQSANFKDFQSSYNVSSYYNLDYADIRGFRITLNRRKGAFTGSINYQYSYATGKSATPTAATATLTRDSSGVVTTDRENVPTRDIVLDFDRTHNLVITAGYITGKEWGPVVLNKKPFANINITVRSIVRSGRPYTSPFDIRLINAERAPMEYNTDLRITKTIRNFMGVSASFYLEVFNLFSNKILNYDYVFDRPTATNPNLPLQYYEQYPINDKENGIRYWWDKGRQGPFSVDQSFLIYDNQPRSYGFGIVFEF
ncbi:MAG: TonB-dependent receptor [Calditrichaceae bacterium]|nr:TonB-dependent receptor [Calditrichaceae bacterium]